MKVLWVCNVMLPLVAEALGKEVNNKEGWLSGLSDSILADHKSEITLQVAFPVEQSMAGLSKEIKVGEKSLFAYGFYEDTAHPERYDVALETQMKTILEQAEPDVIHCFGTEFAHSLALLRVCENPNRVLVGIQGVCQVIAKAYMADLPKNVYQRKSFRDYVKADGLVDQQRKFEARGQREQEILSRAYHIAGRTDFDCFYAKASGRNIRYHLLNESLRKDFYEVEWKEENCIPHSIFMSQGDYPLKGLHYMLPALAIVKQKYPKVKLFVAGNSLVRYETLKDKIKISGYGKYLRKQMDKLGVTEQVEICGKLTSEQMKERYLKSNVYVCCSANENSPNSLGEAMLLGMPCVAARVGGISSVFTEEDGYLYSGSNYYLEEGDLNYSKPYRSMDEIVQNLAKAIMDCLEQKQETKRRCANARLHAAKTHNREENYRRLLEIYSEIANSEA